MLNVGFKVNLLKILEKNYLPNEDCVMICEVDNMKSQRDITSVKC